VPHPAHACGHAESQDYGELYKALCVSRFRVSPLQLLLSLLFAPELPLPSAADHGQGRLRKKGLGEGAKLALPCTVGREFPEPQKGTGDPFL
jgi:hypothetical protein